MGKGPGSVYEQSHLNAIRWTHNKNRPYDVWNPATGLGHVQQYVQMLHTVDHSEKEAKTTNQYMIVIVIWLTLRTTNLVNLSLSFDKWIFRSIHISLGISIHNSKKDSVCTTYCLSKYCKQNNLHTTKCPNATYSWSPKKGSKNYEPIYDHKWSSSWYFKRMKSHK
jgi:hypothetical protein